MTTNFFSPVSFIAVFGSGIRDGSKSGSGINWFVCSLGTCWNAPGEAEENDPVPLLEGPLGTPLPRPVVHSQHLRLTQQVQFCLLFLHTILTLYH
jgi:hypothetical protein